MMDRSGASDVSDLPASPYSFDVPYQSSAILLRKLDEPSKYDSDDFAAASIDELTKNQVEIFDEIGKRIRWPPPGMNTTSQMNMEFGGDFTFIMTSPPSVEISDLRAAGFLLIGGIMD